MIRTILTLTAFLLGGPVFAQYQIGLVPRQSPDQGVYQKIGYTSIEIRYGSPRVAKREIWGNMAPYGKVWRAGANNATTIEFSEEVMIEGQSLPKGKYAFFVIPKERGKWTLIFNKTAKQWGAFSYQADADALRVEVLPDRSAWQERLQYQIEPVGFEYGRVNLRWGDVKLSFVVETAYLSLLADLVEERVAKADENIRWVVYMQGAEYLINQEENLMQAGEWLATAEEQAKTIVAWNGQYYPKNFVLGNLFWVKARWLAAHEKYQDAISYAEKMKALDGKYTFYQKENESENINELLSDWQAALDGKR
ncbi:MAG: DUF2911 domain-containing protein [Saprospiraceae bacterium]|nr:DUF2911 domain-containing protein [Saprospiraceae bacterium]